MGDYHIRGNDPMMVPLDENLDGWTFRTLKAYLDQRFDALETSILKTEQHVDDRFTGVNEFRAALNDLTGTMMPRSEYQVQHQSLSDRVVLNDKRFEALNVQVREIIARQNAERQGLGIVGSIVAGGIAAGGVLMAILTFFLKH